MRKIWFKGRLKNYSSVSHLRKGNTLLWHFVCKMSGLFGTFADRLCQVIFVRSLSFFVRCFCCNISCFFVDLLSPNSDTCSLAMEKVGNRMLSLIPGRHQRVRSMLTMVVEGLNLFALKKCINLDSFLSTRVFIF